MQKLKGKAESGNKAWLTIIISFLYTIVSAMGVCVLLNLVLVEFIEPLKPV